MLFGVPFNSFAFDEWKSHNTVLQATATALIVADWAQTRQFVHNQPGTGQPYEKVNPFLRHNPDIVDIYFPACIILNAAVAYVLPEPYRTVWQSGSIVFEAVIVERNHSLGVKIKF